MTSVILKMLKEKMASKTLKGDETQKDKDEPVQLEEYPQIDFPPLAIRLQDINIGVLFNGNYETRRVVITKEHTIFSEVDQEEIIDFIPLAEIHSVDDLDGVTAETPTEDSANLAGIASLETVASTESAFQIRTLRQGYNRGRKYCLQAKSDHQCEELIALISGLSKAAIRRREIKSVYQRVQERVKEVYDSTPFQLISASFIFANFCTSAVEAQLADKIVNTDGTRSELGLQLDTADMVITVLFAVELLINIVANWFWPFASSWLNIWDLIIVTLSVATLGPLEIAMPMTILRFFRVVRTIRVLKIFTRLPELKKIISALTHSIVPMLNAFMIVLVMMLMYAIVGVTYFRDDAPDDFGRLDRAFLCMFRITAGETWVDSIPRVLPDGTLNSVPVIFFLTYIALVNWILVQASNRPNNEHCTRNSRTMTLGGSAERLGYMLRALGAHPRRRRP
jgi:hypothetical protein